MSNIDSSPATFKLPPALAVSDSEDDELARRIYPETPHLYRSAFARDGARILHAKAFRRLAGKTQVFTRRAHESDHSRNRLTHTLEVAQIARTVASTLGLNTALAEALALVHDIGHPPFGHAGEQALDRELRRHGLSFDHNLHALRIVTSFEERYAAFSGLNLTLGVREGILKHSRDYTTGQHANLGEDSGDYFWSQRPPLEAQLIDVADEIAYITADIEDGLSAGVLDLKMLCEEVSLFAGYYSQAAREFRNASASLLTHEALKHMLNALVTDLMQQISGHVLALNPHSIADIRQAPQRLAHLSPAMEARRKETKSFLYAHLYQSSGLEIEHAHADEVIQTLFARWTAHPELLPSDHQLRAQKEGVPRAVADYIAGMTDSYIEQAWLNHQSQS